MAIKRFSSKSKVNTLKAPMSATGGAVSVSGGYKYHTFSYGESTAGATFTPSISGSVEVLVVAGAGGGGGQVGGGGGAGGLIYHTSYAVTAGTGITPSIGRGGDGARTVVSTGSPSRWSGNDAAERGANGSDSTFGSMTAVGGGGAGGFDTSPGTGNTYAQNGGSGGGGGASSETTSYTTAGTATQTSPSGGTGYGYAGGNGLNSSWAGGGGGGAGGVGQPGTSGSGGTGGVGGLGLQFFGDWYAAGGSGCSNSLSTRIPGTNNIGGRGGSSPSGSFLQNNGSSDGMANRGAGGGGSRDHDSLGYFNIASLWRAGTGGSGIVIVRYLNI